MRTWDVSDSLVQDYVLSVAVSHDGQWVVSGSKDRGVQFWDAKSAIVQLMLQGHKNSGPYGRSIRPRPARADSLPFQSSQLTSAPPEVCWQPVQAIGRPASVSTRLHSKTGLVVDRGPFRELHYRFLIAVVSEYNLSCILSVSHFFCCRPICMRICHLREVV